LPSDGAPNPPSARPQLRRITSAPGRVSALLLLVALVILRAFDPVPIKTIRMRGYDFEQQLAPRAYQPLKVPIRIVAIDGKTIARYGQWPWPRTQLAGLVDKIAAGKPSVLGVDMIFSEPDRFSPSELATRIPDIPKQFSGWLETRESNDAVLARAFAGVPTVLGIAPSTEVAATAPGHQPTTIVRESGGDPRPFLPSYDYLIYNLPLISKAARGRGVLTGPPDRDGILRRIPLFVVAERKLSPDGEVIFPGKLLPTLALEMFRIAACGGTIGILSDDNGVQGASVCGVFFPTDRHGYAYPYFTPSFERRYVSAADVLDGSFDASAFKQAAAMLDQMSARRLAALAPQAQAQALCTQARGYLDRGLLLEAERLYQAAAAADGKNAEAHAGLAQVRERSGDSDAARKEAQAALELAPSATAYLVLARLDLAAGQLDTANADAGNALKLDPANRAAKEIVRQVQVRTGQSK